MIGGIYNIAYQEVNIKNRVHNYYFDNLIKAKKIETKNILIDEKNYNYFLIYFTKYVYRKSRKMLSLHYHELMKKIEEHEGSYIWWLMIIF